VKYTNKLDLPAPLVAALKHDEYSAGHSDYTPSSLQRPAYMQKLEETVEPEQDVADMVYSMMGKAIHNVIEKAGTGEKSFFSEERVYTKFEKWTISMQFDSLYLDAKNGILDDYKSCSVYKFKLDHRKSMPAAPEWELQLNIGAYILRKGGYTMNKMWAPDESLEMILTEKRVPFSPIHINQIRIIGILKDYHQSQAKREWQYPQKPIQMRNFSIWADEKIEFHIRKRATERDAAKLLPIEEITECSKEEVWASDDKWALMKKNRKSAVKLFNNKANLISHTIEKDLLNAEKSQEDGPELKGGHYIEFRPAERKRCESYCNVSHACPFFKKFKEEK